MGGQGHSVSTVNQFTHTGGGGRGGGGGLLALTAIPSSIHQQATPYSRPPHPGRQLVREIWAILARADLTVDGRALHHLRAAAAEVLRICVALVHGGACAGVGHSAGAGPPAVALAVCAGWSGEAGKQAVERRTAGGGRQLWARAEYGSWAASPNVHTMIASAEAWRRAMHALPVIGSTTGQQAAAAADLA